MRFPLELNPIRSGFGSIIHGVPLSVNDDVEDLKDLFTVGTLAEHGQHELFGHDKNV